jgi:hypothetical protein
MTYIYATAEAATRLNVSERWLADQLRAKRFPGRKMAGKWQMTDDDDDDIAAAIATDIILQYVR